MLDVSTARNDIQEEVESGVDYNGLGINLSSTSSLSDEQDVDNEEEDEDENDINLLDLEEEEATMYKQPQLSQYEHHSKHLPNIQDHFTILTI